MAERQPGPAAGDELLVEVAGRLRASVRAVVSGLDAADVADSAASQGAAA